MSIVMGENHHCAKITEADVRKIRALAAEPCVGCGRSMPYEAIGKRFGISAVAVHNIIHRQSWKHVA